MADSVNELGVDGVDRVDVVCELISERFKCLASESGTGNKLVGVGHCFAWQGYSSLLAMR